MCTTYALIAATVDTDECDKQGATCIPLVNCKWAIELLHQNKTPQICGFDGKTPRVCCPTFSGLRLMNSGDFIKKGKNV